VVTVNDGTAATPDVRSGRLFVGRAAELAQIAGALDDAAAGRGRLVVLSGEPGIGKTSLADQATAAAAARGLAVLWGRCWEAGGAPAYWPWLAVLSALAARVEAGRLAPLLGDGAALLGELLPELAARLPERAAGAAPPGDEGRFRLWRSVLALVREAARADAGAGIAVVLDDLHAADRSSLLLLHFLARELRPLPVLILATYRDAEARVDPEVSDLLSRIGREGAVLALRRLDREASASFVRGRAGAVAPEIEARIVDSTQGNPLFLEEMVRLYGEQGGESIAAGAVPHGVRDLIRQRLARLDAEARALLDLAAVAGDEIDVALLVAASGRDATVVAARLEEAARAGVAAARDSGGRRRFAHALFREVLYRELGEAERRALHGRVAEALERLTAPVASGLGPPPPWAELAHHALAGPPELLARAVDHAVRAAGRAQELAAYDDAVAVLTRARAAVGDAGNPPALRSRVLVALGQAYIRKGDTVAGQTAAREAAAVAQAEGDADLLARAALTYGRVFRFGAVDPVLVGMLEEALEALPAGDSALRARLLARLGAALQPDTRLEEPMQVAREAIATARRLGDPATLLETLHDAISALMDVAPPAEQRALNLEAEHLARELGDRERLLRTTGRLALAHLSLGELEAVDASVAAHDALAAELKAPWYAWRGHFLRAMRALMQGRFADAERLGAEALRVGRAAGDPVAAHVWTSNREGLLRAAERHDEMLAFEPEMRRARSGYRYSLGWQASGAALVYARLEDEAGAQRNLDLMPEDFRPPNLFSLFFLAEPAALVGARETAGNVYARIAALPDEYVVLGMSYMSWEGPSSRLLGLLAASLERWDEATAHFEDAIARCRRLGARPYLARTEYEHGRALLARGRAADAERARALVASARAAALELDMPGLARLAERRAGTGSLGAVATSAAAAPPAPAAPPTPAALPFDFALEGEYWTITHADATFRLKDSLGLQYVMRLLREPGRELHVLDLAGERAGADGAEVVDTGDAGELLDGEARASYQRRLEDLRDELAEAESFGDAARAARAREEIEFLGTELSRAVGLGGRARRAGAAAERARSAVQRRIKNALERIGEHAPALAAHLARTIRTGNFCVYRPDTR
jgi:hypothetical protein